MKDTKIPLDQIAINDDDEVVLVYTAQPEDETLVPFMNAKYILEVNAESGIVEGDEFEILFLRKPAALAEGPVGCLHAAESRARIFKGVVDVAVLPHRVGIHKRRNLDTSRRVADHRPVLLMQGTRHSAYTDRRAAACTQSVSRCQPLRPLKHGFEAEILRGRCCIFIVVHHVISLS